MRAPGRKYIDKTTQIYRLRTFASRNCTVFLRFPTYTETDLNKSRVFSIFSTFLNSKALMHMHEHCVLHRDIRASNIMLTKEGEVKLVDFGLARMIKGEMGKRCTLIGSPNWMAPEVVTSKSEGDQNTKGGGGGSNNGYGSRADVWAVGITAIELADGNPPFGDMHPTRALFQIVRNPPPTCYRPANWTQNFNDFIAELSFLSLVSLTEFY